MTNITTPRPGEHFMFKGFEWVCLDPNHPDGGVLAIMATPLAKEVKFCPDERYGDEYFEEVLAHRYKYCPYCGARMVNTDEKNCT